MTPEERWSQPWIALVRQRCPLLDLGFQLEASADLGRDGAEPDEPGEEEFADDFAEMVAPHELLAGELDRAGEMARHLLRRAADGLDLDVGLRPGEGWPPALRARAHELVRAGEELPGLTLLEGVNRDAGADLAAALAEAGHKLTLVIRCSPAQVLSAELDAVLAPALADLADAHRREGGVIAERLAGPEAVADLLRRVLDRLDREVS
jgi:hypothetical protein